MVEELKSISDFEWASVTQYLVWVSSYAGLVDIDTSYVVSFRVTESGGLEALEKRKNKAVKILKHNLSRLEAFAGENKGELGEHELSVLRSLYRQYNQSLEMVKNHLKVIEKLKKSRRAIADFFDVAEEAGGGYDDLPF